VTDKIIVKKEGPIGHLIFNNPEKLNAISLEMWEGMGKGVGQLEGDPEVKVIVLTMHDSEKYMVFMLELGVHSFLQKNTDPEELEKAIHSVIDHDFYYNELLNTAIYRSMQGKAKFERPSFGTKNLTNREEEILKLICNEKSLKEIAHSLSVSEKTVQSHKLHIHNKLGVKSTVGLVKAAYELGLIQ